jgi:hypothetical protein
MMGLICPGIPGTAADGTVIRSVMGSDAERASLVQLFYRGFTIYV